MPNPYEATVILFIFSIVVLMFCISVLRYLVEYKMKNKTYEYFVNKGSDFEITNKGEGKKSYNIASIIGHPRSSWTPPLPPHPDNIIEIGE